MEFSFDRFYQLNRKAIIWVVLFGLIYLLRNYFTLVFLTFIIGFFAFPVSRFLMNRLRLSRGFSITLVYLGIFLGYIAIYVAISRSLVGQVGSLQAKLPSLQANLYERRDQFVRDYPQMAKVIGFTQEPSLLRDGDVLDWPGFYARLNAGNYAPSKWLMAHIPEATRAVVSKAATESAESRDYKPNPLLEESLLHSLNTLLRDRSFYQPSYFREVNLQDSARVQELLAKNRSEVTDRELQRLNRLVLEAAYPEYIVRSQFAEDELQSYILKYQKELQQSLPQFGIYMVEFFINSIFAIFFSFLISSDYVRLSRYVEGIASAPRLRDFFEEAGQPVVRFASTVGQGVQALVIIAGATTCILIPILATIRIPSLALLSLITFVTSLLPVIGVPVQATAIGLIALNERGVEPAVAAVVAVMIVHVFTGYVITPYVFGRQFKMNLVLILIILFIGHRVGGVWGMILGVPIANYILRDVLKVPLVDDVTKYKNKLGDIISKSRKYAALTEGGPGSSALNEPTSSSLSAPTDPRA